MDIYIKKQRYKLILLIIAIVIGVASLWYANILLKQLAEDEWNKIELWASAIQKKAYLVRYTNELFDNISVEERKKVELWAKAVRKLSATDENADIDFLVDVIKDNTTIPVLLVDENYKFKGCRNFDPADSLKYATDPVFLKEQINNRDIFREPIENKFYKERKDYIFYKDSRVFTQLKAFLNDMLKTFITEVVKSSVSVPVIYADNSFSTPMIYPDNIQKHIIAYGNLDSLKMTDTTYVMKTISSMRTKNKPIKIELGNNEAHYIFFKDSPAIIKLKYYPYILIAVILIFILVAYSLFSVSRRAEQNQVWAGMAKETAHQLGTPLSSLIAWSEIIKSKKGIEEISDIEKDIKRLQTITERFSKIGSAPKLQQENIYNILDYSINYMLHRIPDKVKIHIHSVNKNILVPLNVLLFEWVIENLIKNAVDSMNGIGYIDFIIIEENRFVNIDVSDIGKGIPKSKFKTIFNPGYTTKQRGWGLGLAICKRIIEYYHSGKIFVKHSELNKGTTFRIVLKK